MEHEEMDLTFYFIFIYKMPVKMKINLTFLKNL